MIQIADIILFLDDKDTHRNGWSSDFVDTSFETMPSEFISFAESDLQSTFEHRYINALSNAKRSLDCQTDRLLKLLGYHKEAQKKMWGFPTKLEVLQKFDIIAPRVLQKINKVRNVMEHQYIKPNHDQVEDFLEIVSLFITSTDRYTTEFRSEIHYRNEENETFKDFPPLNITIDYQESKLLLYVGSNPEHPNMIKYGFKPSEPQYVEIFKRHLKKIRFM